MKDEREQQVDIESGAEEKPSGAASAEDVESTSNDTAADAREETTPSNDLSLELENEQRRAKEFEDRFLRTAAEFENYKKRMSRQYEDVVRTANDKLLLELLEVVDNFERAMQHNGDDDSDTPLRKGTELIYNQLQSILQRHGVTPIEAIGRPFDANLHEAMMEVASEEYDVGIVAMEITRGYMHNDRVLRHSKVGVSKGPAEPENDQ